MTLIGALRKIQTDQRAYVKVGRYEYSLALIVKSTGTMVSFEIVAEDDYGSHIGVHRKVPFSGLLFDRIRDQIGQDVIKIQQGLYMPAAGWRLINQ